MLRIKFYQGSKSMENYLNKKANKGYSIETISTFGLFEPLRVDAYQFKKSTEKDRVYRVDSRKLSNDDRSEYKQIFADDGWKFFNGNHVNDNFNVDNIFYSDDPTKREIFSDEASERKRNHDNAAMRLFEGFVLFLIFILFSIMFPSVNSGSSNTMIGFILHNSYVIVAILIMMISLIRYFKSR